MKHLFLMLLMFAPVDFSFAAPKEPQVVMFTGKVNVNAKDGKMVPVKRGQVLRELAIIETGEKSLVLLALTKSERLFVGPSSRVLLPAINWEDGSVDRIELDKGKMRLQNLGSTGRVVVTPISRDPYSEADLLFDYDPEQPSLKVSVLEGRTAFRGLENEEFLPLSRGEQVTFTGMKENGEIAFDVLLQGRRVARGGMSEKSRMPTDPKGWWNEFERLHAQAEALRAKEAAAVKKRELLGAICKKPEGLLNQCAWICEGNPKGEKKKCRVEKQGVSCARYRCDANGTWADRFELIPSKSVCTAEPRVAKCDY